MSIRQHQFGITDRKVPVVGQGTWYLEKAERRTAIAALRAGLDLGMTHIDTAEMYGSGAAEEIVGGAIASRRDEVFLVSKVLPQHASRPGTIAACENSLARLRTDRLDCYLLHWRGRYPLQETIEAFERLQREGKILSWGVSNFDVSDLEEARKIGVGHIACNQVLYHLEQRAIEHEVIPWCEKHGVAVVGYSPFAHSRQFASRKASKVLEAIAANHNATARQIALAFLVRRPSLFTIPKAANLDHVRENAAGGSLQLNDSEIALIDETFPLGRARSVPTL